MKAFFGPGGNSEAFFASGRKSSKQAPEWVASMGLNAYEYQGGKGIFGSEETFREIGRAAAERGIRMSLHAPYYISLSGLDEQKRLGSIKYILQSLTAADFLGAYLIVVHPGSCAKTDRAHALSLAADTVQRAVAAAGEAGLSHIKIGLETMGKINQLGTLDEIIELCKIDDMLRPVVDFGHLYARSHGEDMSCRRAFVDAFDKISRELGEDIAKNLHCHFSKIEYSAGGEVKHLTFEDSSFGPDPLEFARALSDVGATPTVICESNGTMDIDAALIQKAYLGEI